jgi:hypothetical protein
MHDLLPALSAILSILPASPIVVIWSTVVIEPFLQSGPVPEQCRHLVIAFEGRVQARFGGPPTDPTTTSPTRRRHGHVTLPQSLRPRLAAPISITAVYANIA